VGEELVQGLWLRQDGWLRKSNFFLSVMTLWQF
jgi:hypothetical protein